MQRPQLTEDFTYANLCTPLTSKQAMQAIGCGRNKLYELVASGELRTIHIGSRFKFDPADIAAYKESIKTGRK